MSESKERTLACTVARVSHAPRAETWSRGRILGVHRELLPARVRPAARCWPTTPPASSSSRSQSEPTRSCEVHDPRTHLHAVPQPGGWKSWFSGTGIDVSFGCHGPPAAPRCSASIIACLALSKTISSSVASRTDRDGRDETEQTVRVIELCRKDTGRDSCLRSSARETLVELVHAGNCGHEKREGHHGQARRHDGDERGMSGRRRGDRRRPCRTDGPRSFAQHRAHPHHVRLVTSSSVTNLRLHGQLPFPAARLALYAGRMPIHLRAEPGDYAPNGIVPGRR